MPEADAIAEAPCPACGDALVGLNQAVCSACRRPFHLIMRTDVPGKDCGQVWINEESLGLEFACHPCLGQAPPAPAGAPRRRYVRRERVRRPSRRRSL